MDIVEECITSLVQNPGVFIRLSLPSDSDYPVKDRYDRLNKLADDVKLALNLMGIRWECNNFRYIMRILDDPINNES